MQLIIDDSSPSAKTNHMIFGIGIDLVEVPRIAASYEKFGEQFLNRVLLPKEIAYCLAHKKPAPFLAVRFAAKEAVVKAFGTGISAELGWLDIEICRRETGAPYVVLHGKGQELFAARGAKQLHLSLTHTDNYAAATAILEG